MSRFSLLMILLLIAGCQTVNVQVAPKGAISVGLDRELETNKTHATMKFELKL